MFKILIVENNLLFSQALRDALQAHFPTAELAQAESVQAALAALESMRPDLIFLDIGLPDGNGLELARRLRAAGVDAVIAIFTTHDLPEYRDEAARSGANHFLVKGSTSLSEIFALAESALASRSSP